MQDIASELSMKLLHKSNLGIKHTCSSPNTFVTFYLRNPEMEYEELVWILEAVIEEAETIQGVQSCTPIYDPSREFLVYISTSLPRQVSIDVEITFDDGTTSIIYFSVIS